MSKSPFNIQQAAKIYRINEWGCDYFTINNKGHLVVHPTQNKNNYADLFEIVTYLKNNNLGTPLNLKFPQMLTSRVKEINEGFRKAIKDANYKGEYCGVFPIKANQVKEVVEQITEAGNKYHYGLEAGSKPELVIALSVKLHEKSMIFCNGYKDKSIIRMALLAKKAGRNVVIAVEKLTELSLIINIAKELQVKPLIGLRAKLSNLSSGKWESSSGDKAKFGLTSREILEAVSTLSECEMLDSIVELHFHAGSQITDIHRIKELMKEAVRLYAKLNKMGVSIKYLNIGGGLGVDYDGSRTTASNSLNYTLSEYATDVVWITKTICDQEKVPEPNLISESGRAVTAYHQVVVVNIFDVINGIHSTPMVKLTGKDPDVIKNLAHTRDAISIKNASEMYHDAIAQKEELLTLFSLGYLEINDLARGETIYEEICQKLLNIFNRKSIKYIPEEIQDLKKKLVDKFFANFSLFQSLPDYRSVEQLFPIMPIHRLQEKPKRSAILCDATCDNNGKVDKFINLNGASSMLPLHEPKPGEPYYVAFFLTGAYQDTLSTRYNLFGSPNQAHVIVDNDGDFFIQKIVPGQTNNDLLKSVHYDPDELIGYPSSKDNESKKSLKKLLREQLKALAY